MTAYILFYLRIPVLSEAFYKMNRILLGYNCFLFTFLKYRSLSYNMGNSYNFFVSNKRYIYAWINHVKNDYVCYRVFIRTLAHKHTHVQDVREECRSVNNKSDAVIKIGKQYGIHWAAQTYKNINNILLGRCMSSGCSVPSMFPFQLPAETPLNGVHSATWYRIEWRGKLRQQWRLLAVNATTNG